MFDCFVFLEVDFSDDFFVFLEVEIHLLFLQGFFLAQSSSVLQGPPMFDCFVFLEVDFDSFSIFFFASGFNI